MPAAAAALLLAGCPGRPCPDRPHPSAQTALDAYRDMRRPALRFRAEARVDQRNPDGRIRGTVGMIVERPDRVRFDAFTQFGPAAILTSDGETFALTDLRENVFLTGATCPANLERLLGLRLPAEELTRVLLGESPRIGEAEPALLCADGRYRATLRDADGRRQTLEYALRDGDEAAPPEEQRLRLRVSELYDGDGTLLWRITYDDYRVLADPTDPQGRGVAMPFEVRFVEPPRDLDTLVRFRSMELNLEPEPALFTQRPRPGLTVRVTSCE
jgi:hypothetical protein